MEKNGLSEASNPANQRGDYSECSLCDHQPSYSELWTLKPGAAKLRGDVGEPANEVQPAITGLDLEDRIDQSCGRLGEYESLSDSDGAFRENELLRLMRRLYPEDNFGSCAADMAKEFSGLVDFRLRLNQYETLRNSALGTPRENSISSVKGYCTNMLLEYYDSHL